MALFLDPKYTFVHDGTKFKNPNGISLLKTTRRGFDRIDGPGQDYRLVVNGVLGPPKPEQEALSRTRTLLREAEVGELDLRVRAYDATTGEFIDSVRFFKTGERVPVADTPGVVGIDRIAGYLNLRFASAKTFRYAGICVCKPDSDHRDCAAIDWFDTPANMEEARDYLLDSADYFSLKYVILYDRIYGNWNNFEPEPYHGQWHAHVHASVSGGIPGGAC